MVLQSQVEEDWLTKVVFTVNTQRFFESLGKKSLFKYSNLWHFKKKSDITTDQPQHCKNLQMNYTTRYTTRPEIALRIHKQCAASQKANEIKWNQNGSLQSGFLCATERKTNFSVCHHPSWPLEGSAGHCVSEYAVLNQSHTWHSDM